MDIEKYKSVRLSHNQEATCGRQYYIYILASNNNNVLYTGVTRNIIKRVYEHKNKLVDGFTKQYNCEKLVYFEIFKDVKMAITREKYIKSKKRSFKEELISAINPEWLDLYDYLIG